MHPNEKLKNSRSKINANQPTINQSSNIFVCTSRIFFSHVESRHFQWRAANFNLYTALMADEQCAYAFLSVQNLLWHGTIESIINMHVGYVNLSRRVNIFVRGEACRVPDQNIHLWGWNFLIPNELTYVGLFSPQKFRKNMNLMCFHRKFESSSK